MSLPSGFLIDGVAYDVIDEYEPDPSVGMFGERGCWVCLAGVEDPPDEETWFVSANDLAVYDHDNDPTGQIATVIA